MITIDLKSKEAEQHFVEWFSGSGEQDYWTWMEVREGESDYANITALRFDCEELNITANMGRLNDGLE